jgi:hypothetical protein
MIDKNSCKLIISYNEVKLMIDVVRYDGLLDLSLSKDCRRLTHPTFYHSTVSYFYSGALRRIVRFKFKQRLSPSNAPYILPFYCFIFLQ